MKTYASILIFICIFLGLGLSPRLNAQQYDQLFQLFKEEPFDLMSASAPYTGITVASITVSPTTQGVPCFECVPNAGPHVALPLPYHAVPSNRTNWSTIIVFDSSLPEGGCSVSMSWLHLGSHEVIVGPRTLDVDNCASNWGVNFFNNITIPDKVGDVMVIGTVKSDVGPEAYSSELIKIIK